MLRDFIRGLQEHAGRYSRIVVWHGDKPLSAQDAAEDEVVYFILPVRSPLYRRRSVARRRLNEAGQFDDEDQLLRNILKEGARRRARFKFIGYEALMEDFDSVTRDLAAWLGYDWVPFKDQVVDGNRKYREPSHKDTP